MTKIKRLPYSILLTILVTTIISCNKRDDFVPNVFVDVYIDTSLPSYFDISSPGGWMYINNEGSQGLIIYRYDLTGFLVYDRHATFEPINNCILKVEDDLSISDPCSSSTYSIFDGSIITGPANQPLKTYQTSFNGNILRIYN